MTEQLTSSASLPEELEKLAEGLESRNFHFVTLCLNKILIGLVPDSAHPQENEASSTAGVPEAHKVIKAIDSGDFPLAGLCLRKAIRAFAAEAPLAKASNPGEARVQLDQIASHLERKEFSSVADGVRRVANLVRYPDAPALPQPEATTGAPAVTPPSASEEELSVEDRLREELARVEKERDQLLEDLNLARAKLTRLRQTASQTLGQIAESE